MQPEHWIIAGFLALAAVGFLIALRASQRLGLARNAHLREIAERLGLEYSETPSVLKILPPEPAVSGRIRGRPARLHAFTRGTGKSRTHWVAARLECIDAGPLKLSMRTQGPALYEKLAGAFGYKDVVTGDAVFDRTFAVHGNDEAFVKAALIPEVRQKLVAFWPRARAGRFVIESGDAVYEERGSFTSRRTRENIEKAFGVLGDLAAIAEVYKR